jgi:hypothetical protein
LRIAVKTTLPFWPAFSKAPSMFFTPVTTPWSSMSTSMSTRLAI